MLPIDRSAALVFLLASAIFVSAQASASDHATILREGDSESKRTALSDLRNMRTEEASRIAAIALADADEAVRASAAAAVIFMPAREAASQLSKLLTDKSEFVRKEAAYALGMVGSTEAAAPLLDLLRREKDLEVRAAAAHALGQTGDLAAIDPLVALLKRSPKDDEEFLRRSAARSIGQIAQIEATGSRRVVTPQSYLPEKFKELGTGTSANTSAFNSAVPTLSAVLQDKREADDTRREAAFALGAIGSSLATSVLRANSNTDDPFLAEIVREALAKIANREPVN